MSTCSRMHSAWRLHEVANPEAAEATVLLGHVCSIAGQSPAHSGQGLSRWFERLNAAITHRQLSCFFNDNGIPVAYYAWAWLAPETEERIRSTGEAWLHLSEWKEGSSLWIIDLAAPHGHLPYVLQRIRQHFSPLARRLHYCRVARGRTLRRQAPLRAIEETAHA